nr:hypothetical protein BCU50_06540 [Vibrio sp. 10N.286.46.E10]
MRVANKSKALQAVERLLFSAYWDGFKKMSKSRFYKGWAKVDCLKMNKKCRSAYCIAELKN